MCCKMSLLTISDVSWLNMFNINTCIICDADGRGFANSYFAYRRGNHGIL